MTREAARRRLLWQIALLSTGLLTLVAISVISIIFVNKARDDSWWVVHTVEVENQISTVLLDIRRAESAARGYLLTRQARFLEEHEAAVQRILPSLDTLERQTADSLTQIENSRQLRKAVDLRLAEFAEVIDYVKRDDISGGTTMLRDGSGAVVQRISEISTAMRNEENRLFQQRTAEANRSQTLAAIVTAAGSGLVLLLAGASLLLVRRSTLARDRAEQLLRENNVNLEATIQTRTADLREANEEIQRFAYIVSHDLRSPLVNIMGFTSELEELRNDIFNRIAKYNRGASAVPEPFSDSNSAGALELQPEDRQLSQDFSEALGFIKSSIGKMDRLISAILTLTREGRREFSPTFISMRELVETIISTVAHQASQANAKIQVEQLPDIVSDRLAVEQIFSNLVDNALKYLKPGVPGEILIKGRPKLGFVIFEIIDNGRGIHPKDHQRIFDLFRRAGLQDQPGQGIGLAHVRALVRRLGGTINVCSDLHNGSTFTVTLPARWNFSPQGKQ